MRGIVPSSALRVAAIVLVLFQALLPGTVAMAQTSGIDISRILCITPGTEPSEEAQRYAQMMAELLGEEAPEQTETLSDCPLCVLAKAKAPAPALEIGMPPSVSTEIRFPQYQLVYSDRRNGPRLGGRAPPFLI